MPKLRKMLGRADSPQSIALMELIETQSLPTLAAWAVSYARERYLPIYEESCPGDGRFREGLDACRAYLRGELPQSGLKPTLQGLTLAARETGHGPVAQAAARAIATACSVTHSPTGALGFLFYGAAAEAYHQVGLDQPAPVYDRLADDAMERALHSLRNAALPEEAHPVKVRWHC